MSFGPAGLKEIMSEFGKTQGVKQINIVGTPRTTGANPGKIQKVTFYVY